MNPADTNNQKSNTDSQQSIQNGISKERELSSIGSVSEVKEITPTMEIPREVESAGVSEVGKPTELPPDIRRFGVSHSGANTQIVIPASPNVTLPISDQQIVVGMHAKITSAFRWLATWCIRKLKKAHLTLKIVHGKILRVRTN